MDRSRLRRGGLFAACHGAFAVVATWPLLAHLTTSLPLGQEPTPTVPLFNLWSLEWNAERVAHWFANYWDAPAFAPTTGVFARSEAQPLTGLMYATVRPLVGSVGGYNVVLLAFLTLNGVAAAHLARRFHASVPLAIIVGVMAQSLPFVWVQLGVLQLVCVFPMLFAWDALIAYSRTPRLRWALWLTAWCCICALTSGYYAIILGVLVAVAGPILLIGNVPFRVVARHGVIVGTALLIVTAPYFASQRAQLTDEDIWSRSTISDNSARFDEYVTRRSYAVTPPLFDVNDGNEGVAPGLVMTGLALTGVVVAIRRRSETRAVIAGVGASVVLLLSSLGPTFSIFGWSPYEFGLDHFGALERLRSPFRFAVGVQVTLVVLATIALVALWHGRRDDARNRTMMGVWRVGVVLLAAAFVFESVPFAAARREVPEYADFDWVQYLRQHHGGNVAMVPFPSDGKVASFEPTVVAMLAALEHEHPVANGYTGLFPQQFDLPAEEGGLWYAMDTFPSRCAVEQLHRRRVTWVVIDREWLTSSRLEAAKRLGYVVAYDARTMVVMHDERQFPYRGECG